MIAEAEVANCSTTCHALDIYPGDTYTKGGERFYVEAVTEFAMVRLTPIAPLYTNKPAIDVLASELGTDYRRHETNWAARKSRGHLLPTGGVIH